MRTDDLVTMLATRAGGQGGRLRFCPAGTGGRGHLLAVDYLATARRAKHPQSFRGVSGGANFG